MKKIILGLCLITVAGISVNAQVKIGSNPSTINAASLLELESTTSGLLMPRMTLAQKNLIASPPAGLLVFQADGISGFYYYDGSVWQLVGPGSGNYWDKTGNDIYNNNSGNVAVGTSIFDAINPEKFLVDAGTTSSVNAIYAKGTINNYFQMNIRNLSNGNNASSDVIATADNGTESTFYVDMGINGSGYTGDFVGSANDAYIYGSGNNFDIGNVTPGKDVVFFSNGANTAINEKMRLTSNGYVGIGTQSPQAFLHVHNATTGTGSYPLFQLSTGFTGATANDGFTVGLENNSGSYNVQFKTKETGNIEFYGGNSEVVYIKSTGHVGIGNGTSSPNSTLQLGGSMSAPIITRTSSTYAVSATDYTVLCNYSAGTMVVTLPTAAGITGRIYIIKNINASQSVTLNTTASQTIDLTTSVTLATINSGTGQQNCFIVQSNGSNWYVISQH